jgi:ABC-2 type transport system permease protein
LLFVGAARRVHVQWTAWHALFAALSVLGGTLIQASILLVSAAVSFWTIRTTNLRNLIFFNLRRCAGFPLSVYPALLRLLSVYVVPFAFVNYFPAQYLLKKPDGYAFPWIFAYAAPAVGVALFAGALLIWSKGLARYSSAGN